MEHVRSETNDEKLLETIRGLAQQFEAKAEATDQGGAANDLLRSNIRELARAGYFGAAIGKAYGGLEVSEKTTAEGTQILSAACGVTAFTQVQLHSGGSFVGGSSDHSLKAELLPRFASGELLCGVAFSHLRRPGPPAVTAQKTKGGWHVNGEAPWVTGWRLLDSFVLGAASEQDGLLMYFYVPIGSAAEALRASEPLGLAAMNSSDTVRVTIDNLFVPDRHLLYSFERSWMQQEDNRRITRHSWLPLGCARGSIHHLESLVHSAKKPGLAELAAMLSAEASRLEQDAHSWNASRAQEPGYSRCALAARAGAITLALRAAASVIAATGGRAQLLTHPAQRRLREAAFYSTLGLTPDVQSALLEVYAHG